MSYLFLNPNQLSDQVNFLLLIISAVVLLASCFRLIISRSLFESVILMSVFSLVIGMCHLFMDAPDVAMTEVALGACLSTCVLLNLVKICGDNTGKSASKPRLIFAIILCVIFLSLLIYASFDLPLYGDPQSPVQSYLTKYYVEYTNRDIGIPSMVAAILASYRGYDTLGETTVILVAGLAVVLILAKRKEDA